MKFCKCKFSYVFDHECDSATAPCPNSDKLSNDNSHNFMKNLSKEEVRTAEEVLRDCSIEPAYTAWKIEHPTTLKWILGAMREYASSQTEQLRQENASLRKQLAAYKEQAGIEYVRPIDEIL